MEKEFVPHQLALRLKALGFDEPCFAKYQKLSESANYKLQLLQKEINCNNLDTAISAPTFSQAFRWFIDEYNLYCGFVEPKTMKIIFSHNTYEIMKKEYYSYIELACLEKLMEIVSELNHQNTNKWEERSINK